MRTRYLILSILLLFGMGLDSFCQNITGKVLDSSDESPLPGVIVKTVDKTGKILSYSASDKDGAFSIALKDGACKLVASLIGYTESYIDAPFAESVVFHLDPSVTRLQESVIEAKKVVMSGDTTRYSVTALKTRDDFVLGDLLKRIPGIDVSNGGAITVDGKALGKFYVDGRDILGSNYNLATDGLSIDAVKSLEVIRNHQPMKMLQGIKEGEDAAINVLLSDSAKGRVNWKGRLSAGVASESDSFREKMPVSASLTAFMVRSGISSVNNVGFDSQGNVLADSGLDISNLPFADVQHSLNKFLSVSPQTSPLGDFRSTFGYDAKARTVNTFSTGEEAILSSTIKYSNGMRSSSVEKNRTFLGVPQDEDGTFVSTVEERMSKTRHVQGNVSWVKNASRVYISEKLFAEAEAVDSDDGISGDILRKLDARTRNIDAGNRFALQFRTGDSKVMGVTSYTQISSLDEGLESGESAPSQHNSSQGVFEDISVLGLSRTGNHWTVSMKPGISWIGYKRKSSLSGLSGYDLLEPLEDRTSAGYMSAGIAIEAVWSKKSFKTTATSRMHYDVAAFSGKKEGKFIPDVSLKFDFVKGKMEAGLSLSHQTVAPDVQNLGTSLILRDFDVILRLGQSVLFLPSSGIAVSFLFRNPVDGWNLRMNSNFSKGRIRLSGRDFLGEEYRISYASDVTCPQSVWTSVAQLSKGFYAINGNLDLSISHTRLSSDFRSGGDSFSYSSAITVPSVDANILLTSFWRINFAGSVSMSEIRAVGVRTSLNARGVAKLTNVFYPAESVSVSAQTDFHYDTSVKKTAAFVDLSASWTVGKVRLNALISNLMNVKEYSYMTISPLEESHVKYKLRPFTVLLGLDWTF
ncbi:MAG: carboxypeptidase-like regulatory domain-containing protein [Bacteroidales bacterium]|nr:carboxypeptidase-like regulatory domain-containing protein [Bacteroidales bacterium]